MQSIHNFQTVLIFTRSDVIELKFYYVSPELQISGNKIFIAMPNAGFRFSNIIILLLFRHMRHARCDIDFEIKWNLGLNLPISLFLD